MENFHTTPYIVLPEVYYNSEQDDFEELMSGNLRQYLNDNHNQLSFGDKLGMLYTMANGLCNIHSQGLIHRDFHP
ncbi:1260_t:CDS:2, partial [Racocetra persica]